MYMGATQSTVKGDTGPRGIQGIKGDIGPQGPQGIKGDTGPQGIKGDIGPQGIQGQRGLSGIDGNDGLKGDIGPRGIQGIKGDIGPQGISGFNGNDGGIGPRGIPGVVGPQGIKGDTGPQGISGVAGPQGIPGDTGLQGIQGIQGPKIDAGDFDKFSEISEFTFVGKWITDNNKTTWSNIRGGSRKGIAYTEIANDTIADNVTANIEVPSGVITGYLVHLNWDSGRFFDIYGVLPSDSEIFINRIDAYQHPLLLSSTGGEHSGSVMIPISRVNRFKSIKITARVGRIHLMGMGWSENILVGQTGNGFVHALNIHGNHNRINVKELCDQNGANCLDFAALSKIKMSGSDVLIQHGGTHTNFGGNKTVYFPGNVNVPGALEQGSWVSGQVSNGNWHIGHASLSNWNLAVGITGNTVNVRGNVVNHGGR